MLFLSGSGRWSKRINIFDRDSEAYPRPGCQWLGVCGFLSRRNGGEELTSLFTLPPNNQRKNEAGRRIRDEYEIWPGLLHVIVKTRDIACTNARE